MTPRQNFEKMKELTAKQTTEALLAAHDLLACQEDLSLEELLAETAISIELENRGIDLFELI